MCQEETPPEVQQDTIDSIQRVYGLRLGVDLAKPIRTFIDDSYSGVEITADFRFRKRIFLAAELGTESNTLEFPTLTVSSSGNYIKAGFNYNFYSNWYGERNLIYAGVRLAHSIFDQTLDSFTINSQDFLFGADNRTEAVNFDGLSATWLEVQIGLQFEVVHSVFLGINFQIQNRLFESAPDGFQNVYIPGFGEPTDGSDFSIGFGYTVSYLIPVLNK